MLGDVNKLFVFKSLLTMPSNVLLFHLKQTFTPIIWIFTEVKGDRIESRLPFKIFSTLHNEILREAYSWLWIIEIMKKVPIIIFYVFCIRKSNFISISFLFYTAWIGLLQTSGFRWTKSKAIVNHQCIGKAPHGACLCQRQICHQILCLRPKCNWRWHWYVQWHAKVK